MALHTSVTCYVAYDLRSAVERHHRRNEIEWRMAAIFTALLSTAVEVRVDDIAVAGAFLVLGKSGSDLSGLGVVCRHLQLVRQRCSLRELCGWL